MRPFLLFIFSLLSTFIFAQADAKTYDSTVPNHYFDYSLKLVKETPGFSPPVAARAFGYMGLALYESVVTGIPTHTSTQGLLYELTDVTLPEQGVTYHWPTVANNAMAIIMDSLFRTMTAVNRDSLHSIRDHYNSVFEYVTGAQIFNDSKAFGEAIAHDIFDYSRTDGGHNGFTSNFPMDYVPPVGPDLWIPYGMQTALQPYWGSHRPFLEKDTLEETLPPPPPAFSIESSSEFYDAALKVNTVSSGLTPEQTNIAHYWADGGGTHTPAGHSISMLNDLLTSENADLEKAAIAYAKLGIALSDAFLACWKAKFIHNLCRPVTYIQQYIDPSWEPLIATPPFPEYPSGHSSQSGAMSAVMTDVYGQDFMFTDYTNGPNFGGPRTFDSFQDAAEEAAISRLYGGIHYEFGNNAGLAMGLRIGENVNELFSQLNVSTVDANDRKDYLTMYPNPAMDIVYIKSDAAIIGSPFYLLDLYGKVVLQGLLQHELTTLSLGHISPGLYVLKTNDNTKSYKLSKN